MKKNIFRSIATLTVAAMLMPCITSCGSDDDEGPGGNGGSETSVATQWEGFNDHGKPEFLVLHKDGTGKIESYNVTTDKVEETTDFTYENLGAREFRLTLNGEVRLLQHYAELDKAFHVSEKGHVYNAMSHRADIKGTWQSEDGAVITFGQNGKGRINEDVDITYQPQNDRRGTYATDTKTYYYVIIGNQAIIYENGYGNKETARITKVGDKKSNEPFSLAGHWEGFDSELTPMMIDFEKDGTGKIYSYDLPTDEKIVIDNFSIELSEDDPLSFTFLHENYTKEPYYMNPASELIFLPGKVIPRSAFSRKADIVGQWQTKEKTSYYYFLKDGEGLYVNEDIRAYRAFTYTIDKEGRRGLIDTGSSSSTYFIIIGKWLAWSNIENEINEARILTKQ